MVFGVPDVKGDSLSLCNGWWTPRGVRERYIHLLHAVGDWPVFERSDPIGREFICCTQLVGDWYLLFLNEDNPTGREVH